MRGMCHPLRLLTVIVCGEGPSFAFGVRVWSASELFARAGPRIDCSLAGHDHARPPSRPVADDVLEAVLVDERCVEDGHKEWRVRRRRPMGGRWLAEQVRVRIRRRRRARPRRRSEEDHRDRRHVEEESTDLSAIRGWGGVDGRGREACVEGGNVELNIPPLPRPRRLPRSTVKRHFPASSALLERRVPCLMIRGICPTTRLCSTRSRSRGTTPKGQRPSRPQSPRSLPSLTIPSYTQDDERWQSQGTRKRKGRTEPKVERIELVQRVSRPGRRVVYPRGLQRTVLASVLVVVQRRPRQQMWTELFEFFDKRTDVLDSPARTTRVPYAGLVPCRRRPARSTDAPRPARLHSPASHQAGQGAHPLQRRARTAVPAHP